MELVKIRGNTYYIDAPTNIGVHVFKNKNCIIVDTGLTNGHARKIEEILINNGLHPKYIINTHSHLDHCGGNTYFQDNYPGCVVYTSEPCKVYMENPYLQSSILFSSHPPRELYKTQASLKVDYTLEEGITKINDEKFQILPLRGHSIDQIGVITPEKVCFLGDSIFSSETIKRYGLPYLYDIKDTFDSLNNLRNIDCDFFVPGHSEGFLSRNEFLDLIDINISNIEKYVKQIKELLDQPLSREDLLENLIILNDFTVGYKQYYLYHSSISAFLAYLYNSGEITYSIENGRIYYFNS